jgi:hypothetical protein
MILLLIRRIKAIAPLLMMTMKMKHRTVSVRMISGVIVHSL